MNIFSKIVQKQCVKEYEKEVSKQTYSFLEWKSAQPAFQMQDRYAKAAVLYGDYIENEPVFLPDFSPNRWDYEDYLGKAVYVRQDLYEKIDWDRTSRRMGLKQVIKEAAAQQKEQVVVHVRGILEGDILGFVRLEKLPSRGTFESVSKEQLAEAVEQGISIIIPSKDNPDILRKCLQSVERTTQETALEVLVVDNGSCKEHRIAVEAMCRFITESSEGRMACKYFYEPMEFDFAKMCNIGADKASGAYILFLNDDTEAVEAGWLTKMLAEAVKPYTGAVGMKLLYPDKKRIQHAGISNLPMGPVHKLQFASDEELYYDKRNRGIHNVSAVTGACLMMRKALYKRLGGMNEKLPIAFNDVELCFHAMEQGYYNVVCCDTFLLHHESISRGQDNSEEKRSRLLRERSILYELHPKQVSFDAFYPYEVNTKYGLCHGYLDTAIRPAYEDGRGVIQKAEKLTEVPKQKQSLVFTQKPEHICLNPCLKFQIEQLYQEKAEGIHIAGYSFVIGSDNSQFAYTLVLRGEERLYTAALKPVRRYDLERNMPDQIRVGLAGFHVLLPFGKLAKGRYRLEVYAQDKTSRLRLKQSSNVFMNIE